MDDKKPHREEFVTECFVPEFSWWGGGGQVKKCGQLNFAWLRIQIVIHFRVILAAFACETKGLQRIMKFAPDLNPFCHCQLVRPG